MRHYPAVPRTYAHASAILHDRRIQRLAFHDDLELGFTTGGVAVLYRGRPLLTWTEDGRRLLIDAPGERRGGRPIVAEYLSWFVPPGHGVSRRGGRLRVHHPHGGTTVGNRQAVAMPRGIADYVR